jgi:ABC-type nickel/cobalt efflux system permease component RcnA
MFTEQKGSGEARPTYVLAAGILDVRAAPTASPPIAVAPQKRSCQVPAPAVKTNRQVLLREPPSMHEQTGGEKRGHLQLHSLKGGWNSSRGIWQGHHWAHAIILVGAYNTSQQANLVRVFVFRGGICLPQLLIIIAIIVFIVLVVRGIVLVIIVVIGVVIMVHVVIAVARTSTRRAQDIRGSGRRTIAGG